MEEYARGGGRSDLPWFALYLGNLRWSQSEEAEGLYRRAATGFARLGNEEGEMLARINLGQILTRLGRARDAEAEAARVIAITDASSDPGIQTWGRIIQARRLLDAGGDLAEAYALLHGTEVPASMENAFSLRRDRLILLGNVSMAIGRFREAREAYRGLSEMAVSEGDRYLEATARYNLAWVAYEQSRENPSPALRREAASRAREALEVAAASGNRPVEALAAWIVGVTTPGDEGRNFLERCLAVAESADVRSHCLNPIAARVAETDPKAAQRLVSESLALANQSGDTWAEIRAWQQEMHISWVARPPRGALARSWQALDALERLRDRQSEGSTIQAEVFSFWSDDYAWLVGQLLGLASAGADPQWAATEALGVAERMRARALTDWLRRSGRDSRNAEAGASFELRRVRTALASHEALVSFQVAPWEDPIGAFGGGSWVMVITRDGVHVHRLPGRVEVRRDVKIFEGLVEARNGSETGPGVRLYEKLLAPALADLPASVTRLVLVPDDALHRLPFAALRASADAPPLGARYELVQVPSATLWLDWRREREAAPARPLLVLADPDVATDIETGESQAAVQVAQVRDAGSGLGRLPHARAEGRAAVRALGDGLLLMGPDASEAQVATLPLGDFGLVHFAAHAVTDEDRPERSAVLLAPGGGDYDGRLESAEIAGLHLAGRTVVLASCRSASGSVLRGEGVMSLARAFFQAGAHGVVASLWPLRDDESEALFGRFYRHLAEGESVAAALRRARAEAIAAGEPAAAWAGLVVLGDGSVVPVPGGRRGEGWGLAGWLALGLVLALALAAGAALFWRVRSRRA